MLSEHQTVIYMGFADMENTIKKEGFQFISLTSCTNKNITDLQKRKSYKELGALYKKLHDEILSKFVDYSPDIILMGISRYHFYLIPAICYGAKIYIYSLCGGSPWFNSNSPPITSSYIYTSKVYQRMSCIYLWIKRLLRKGLHPAILYQRMYYPWTTMRHLCRQRKVKWIFGIDGYFPYFPVMTFGTRFLEFSDIKGLHFTGLCVKEDKLDDHAESLSETKPLIYCSLGTMNYRYRKAKAFYTVIIDLFKENPQWNLILSIGKTIEVDRSDISDNITIYEYAPQLHILQNANLVITHGGYGTVKECIKYAVPMLILPCSYDQRGNAARVQYHQIGIMDYMLRTSIVEKKLGVNTRDITPNRIKSLIEKLLLNSKYKRNIEELSKKIENEDELVGVYNELF